MTKDKEKAVDEKEEKKAKKVKEGEATEAEVYTSHNDYDPA